MENEDEYWDISEFEGKISNGMRYKQCDTLEGDYIYWVTQCSYDKKDLERFAKALQSTPFIGAYVTVRDNSSYNLKNDRMRDVIDEVKGGEVIYWTGQNDF